MRADKQAVIERNRKEQGGRSSVVCSAAVGTDSPVWILKRGDWEEADCHDGGFRAFFSFMRFSCLTVSPSRVDSSDILWRKERGAPTIGSGYDCPAWQRRSTRNFHFRCVRTQNKHRNSTVTTGWECFTITSTHSFGCPSQWVCCRLDTSPWACENAWD